MKLSFDWKELAGLAIKGAESAQLITVVNAVLVMVLAYNAAVLSWRLVPAVESEPPSAVLAGSSPQQAAAASGGWNIARWSLFGQESSSAVSASVQEVIPKTRLNLTLRGVFVADNGGGAIIATAGGKEQYYAVNAKLPGGATLKEVHPYNVVLLRSGNLETLELPKKSIETGRSSSSVSARRPVRSAAGGKVDLKQYRRDLMREPQRLTDAIKMSPYSERGRFVGYKVTPGPDRALFDQIGLLSGDIVTAVNGIELDTPAKGLNVLRTLQTASSVRLDIKRDGRSQSFDVNIN